MKKYSVTIKAMIVVEQVVEVEACDKYQAEIEAYHAFDSSSATVYDADRDDFRYDVEYVPAECSYCGGDIAEGDAYEHPSGDEEYCSQECKDFSIDAEREADWYERCDECMHQDGTHSMHCTSVDA